MRRDLAVYSSIILVLLGIVVGLIMSPPSHVEASTLNIPNTFSSGGIIYASQMNQNFDAIRNVVNALDDQNIANASITGSSKLIDGTVTLAKMASDSVNSAKIVDGSIVAADIATGAITSALILDGTIASADILDGTIASADIADNAITEPKIDFASAPSTGFEVFWNGTKLDYRARNTTASTCSQIVWARSSHQFTTGTGSTNYSSFIEQTATGETTEANVPKLRNPAAVTWGNLYVVMDSTPPNNTTFTVRSNGSDSVNCTVNSGGPTTCSESVTFNGLSANNAILNMKTSAPVSSNTTRAYTAFLCLSPY